MKLIQFPHMPAQIKVRILEHKSGRAFYAELVDYDVFTEANNKDELEMMLNDLIYETFSVPQEYQRIIKYVLSENKDKDLEKIKKLTVLSTPAFIKKYFLS